MDEITPSLEQKFVILRLNDIVLPPLSLFPVPILAAAGWLVAPFCDPPMKLILLNLEMANYLERSQSILNFQTI